MTLAGQRGPAGVDGGVIVEHDTGEFVPGLARTLFPNTLKRHVHPLDGAVNFGARLGLGKREREDQPRDAVGLAAPAMLAITMVVGAGFHFT